MEISSSFSSKILLVILCFLRQIHGIPAQISPQNLVFSWQFDILMYLRGKLCISSQKRPHNYAGFMME